MSIAREVNKRLDQILSMRKEIKRMNDDLSDDTQLKNLQTGESTNKAEALSMVEDMIDTIKAELSRITNNGERVKDVFTNSYYINDLSQDKAIVNAQKNNSNNPNKEEAWEDPTTDDMIF